jgi:hypothetical protein
MTSDRGWELPRRLVAAEIAPAWWETLGSAGEDGAATRELPWAGVHVEVVAPVVASGVKGMLHALPGGALGFLEKDAHVAALVGDWRCSA